MILRAIVPRHAWGLAIAAVAAGVLGGACAAALIALINSALHRADLSRGLDGIGSPLTRIEDIAAACVVHGRGGGLGDRAPAPRCGAGGGFARAGRDLAP